MEGAPEYPQKTGAELIVGLMLPYPPSTNRYWRTSVIKLKRPSIKQLHINGGHSAITMRSREAKAYCELIIERIKVRRLNFRSAQPLKLELVVCPPDRRAADISNRIKVVEDALHESGVFNDDSQVEDLRVERGPIIKGGRIIVSVTEIIPDPHGAMRRSRWQGK